MSQGIDNSEDASVSDVQMFMFRYILNNGKLIAPWVTDHLDINDDQFWQQNCSK